MKIKVDFERKDILPLTGWAFWFLIFYLLLTSATGSVEEFEPKAAAVWAVVTGLWCAGGIIFLLYKRSRSID